MPGLDRKGPEGKGSQTGRGMGKCNPNDETKKEFPGRRGRARGMGRFWNRRFRNENSAGNGD